MVISGERREEFPADSHLRGTMEGASQVHERSAA
jgi:hypothetical protein